MVYNGFILLLGTPPPSPTFLQIKRYYLRNNNGIILLNPSNLGHTFYPNLISWRLQKENIMAEFFLIMLRSGTVKDLLDLFRTDKMY